MLEDARRITSRFLTNLPGWRTNRKILVIESDDWGSIRMPSRETYKKCLKAGYPVDKNAYERYDSLASEEDLELLFQCLTSFKDQNGNYPVVTANCVVANPDFKKIREDDFKVYHYEVITETFRRYPRHAKNMDLWKRGIAENIFFPQFHAREHLNVSLFLQSLQNGDHDARWGFENEMPGSIPISSGKEGNRFIEPLRYSSTSDKITKLKIYLEGLDLFQCLFGYHSKSIIPPNYTWSPDFDEAVFERGVTSFQGNRKMIEPMPDNKIKIHHHYLGKKNRFGQVYMVRNAIFEPSLFGIRISNPIDHCLKDINSAFRMHKPAIISSHRLNYVGYIDSTNRNENLKLLSELLKSILKNWPDIEFMSSVKLASIISSTR
jgi:hypothetical protein